MTLQDILLIIAVWGEIFLNILPRWTYFSYSSTIRFEFGFLVLAAIITCVGLWRSAIFVLEEKKQGFEKMWRVAARSLFLELSRMQFLKNPWSSRGKQDISTINFVLVTLLRIILITSFHLTKSKHPLISLRLYIRSDKYNSCLVYFFSYVIAETQIYIPCKCLKSPR